MNKKKDFSAKAQNILKPESMSDFFEEGQTQEGRAVEVLNTGKPESRKAEISTKIKEKEPDKKGVDLIEDEGSEAKVRHEIRLEEDISEQIRFFLYKNKTDKTKFFKAVLQSFFDKPEKDQVKILQKGIKKG